MALRLSTPRYLDNPSTPLLRFGRDAWTVGDAYEGVLDLGGTGSGKTTGSGQALAHAYLRAGWGGLVLCAKPDEAARWCDYARACGREQSLILFDGSGARRFNFLRYAVAEAASLGTVGTVANLITTVLQAASGNVAPAGGGSSEQFWQKAVKECLTHAFAVLWAGTGELRLDSLMKLIHARPAKPGYAGVPPQQPGEAAPDADTKAAWHWQQTSFMAEILEKAHGAPVHPMNPADFKRSFDYLTTILPNPDARTTGNLVQSLSADLDPLMSGVMRELFGTTTNIVPELTHEGAILVMDFPLKVYAEAGLLAQHVMKYLWQRAAEKRQGHGRPVFLWCDEAHLFVSPYDAEFQSTARSARACTVYLTQNLPALYERIGGRNAHDVADALVGNFQTKIFHANSDPRTNQWAADLIGKEAQFRQSLSENQGWGTGKSGGWSSSSSTSSGGQGSSGGGAHGGWNDSRSGGSSRSAQEVIDYRVQPSAFTSLRNGGQVNGGRVEGILFKAAKSWRATRAPWLPVEFTQ